MQRGGISWLTVLIGVGIGLGLGLFYAWRLNPVVVTNTAPWQLSQQGQQNYLIALSLAYSRDHDLNRVVERLYDLRYGADSWKIVADTACQLARTNYASTDTGLIAIRSLVELAQSQGATGCASTLLPLYTPSPAPTQTPVRPTSTLSPPATKTPTPTLGPTFTPATQPFSNATATPAGEFRAVLIEPLCDPKNSSVIQVFVQDADGTGLPGIQIQVASPNTTDTLYSGLKPERDPGYGDFQMAANTTYTVMLPGLSDRSRPMEASQCKVAPADGSGSAVTSYRVIFRRLANQ
jgi:hypothetical protein